jgi:hypothetical protein
VIGTERTQSYLGLLALSLIIPVSALAQDPGVGDEAPPPEEPAAEGDPTERARELFAEGVACVEQHETACAERAFRQALELRDAPAVRYNLASALFDLGRYPEAARLTASVLADETTPEAIRGHAEMLHGQLEQSAGTLQITVAGAEDAEVQIDGETIPASQLASVAVAPGSRVVTAVRGGEELARREVDVEARATVPVELTIVPTAEQTAALAEVDQGEPPAVPLHEDWRFWAAVGGAVAVAVVIIAVVAAVASTGNVEDPISGDYEPGVLSWE